VNFKLGGILLLAYLAGSEFLGVRMCCVDGVASAVESSEADPLVEVSEAKRPPRCGLAAAVAARRRRRRAPARRIRSCASYAHKQFIAKTGAKPSFRSFSRRHLRAGPGPSSPPTPSREYSEAINKGRGEVEEKQQGLRRRKWDFKSCLTGLIGSDAAAIF